MGILVSGEEHQVGSVVLRLLRMLEPRQLLLLLVQDVNSHSVPRCQGLEQSPGSRFPGVFPVARLHTFPGAFAGLT